MNLNVPEPNYDYDINKLVKAYKQAILKISKELETIDVTDFKRTHQLAILNEVTSILKELDADSIKWIEEHLPKTVTDGVARTMVTLGLVESLDEAVKVLEFNKLNKEMIKVVVADTQDDLLAVTQNVEQRVRRAVRRVFSQSMINNFTEGINGRKIINRETIQGLKKTLGDSVNTGIVDAAGRRWKPEVYVDNITRTKMMTAFNEAQTNEAITRGAYYAVISDHNAQDACRFHEGRIIKLMPEAEGDYPTYDELKATGQIFHNNCKHSYSVIRDVDLLPKKVQEKAEKQSILGDKALQTNKRNPLDIE